MGILLGKPFEHALTRNPCLSDSTVKFTAMPKPFEGERLDLAVFHGALQRAQGLPSAAVSHGRAVVFAFVLVI
jgi:hypothetical protein